jgi:hypothetical protein
MNIRTILTMTIFIAASVAQAAPKQANPEENKEKKALEAELAHEKAKQLALEVQRENEALMQNQQPVVVQITPINNGITHITQDDKVSSKKTVTSPRNRNAKPKKSGLTKSTAAALLVLMSQQTNNNNNNNNNS